MPEGVKKALYAQYLLCRVHGGNTALDKRLKEEAEQIFEKKYSRELFREEFGRYYAEEKNKEAKGQQENGFIWMEEETC